MARTLISYEIVRRAGRHACRATWSDGKVTEYAGSGSRGAAYELDSRLRQWLGSAKAAAEAMAGKRIGAEFADEIE